MLSESIRRRLQVLNRQPLSELPKAIGPARGAGAVAAAGEPAVLGPMPMTSAEVVCNASGEHLRLAAPLADVWKSCEERIAQRRGELHRGGGASDEVHPELAAFLDHLPESTLFLDLETCGFAGSAIFLIGLLRQSAAGLVVEQLLARDYSEERAILHSLWQVAAENRVLATFNGKSFDWPMVLDRSTRHRMEWDLGWDRGEVGEPPPELVHFDLLHHARRRWKHELPNCKLQTLEYYICGRRRGDDIPGSRIPAAYADYVRTGNVREMRHILRHNLLDLVTLLQISLRLGG